MAYWEPFMAGEGERPPSMRSLLEQSWRCCRGGAVDHRRCKAPPPLDEDRLHALRQQRRDLLDSGAPVMATARTSGARPAPS